jgi:ribonuclease BN (tRNA processing enzyme)
VIAKASKSEGMQVRFIGCGDAFGSGGRFNTCFHVTGGGASFLIDCGASSLIAMKRFGVDRNGIESILITHFHGDHFGGIPYFMLDAQFFSKRVTPLTIAGRDADLFISEAYFRDKRVKLHLDVASLERHLAEIGPRRVVLTHMSDEMLGRIDEVDFEVAEDGKIVRF